MTRLSIEQSFLWAQRVVAREWGLLLPVALAFIALPPLALELLAPAKMRLLLTTSPATDMAEVQAAMAWLLPVSLALLAIAAVGALTITALAVRSQISVAEAIAIGVRRLPVVIGCFVMLFLALLLYTLTLGTILVFAGVGGGQLQAVMMFLLIVTMVAVLVRMSPLLALVVERPVGPIAAIGETWALGRGIAWKMLAVLAIYHLASLIVMIALGQSLGSVALLGARLGGLPEAGPPIAAVIDRVVSAIAITGSHILGASFYRQLSASSRGI